MYSLRIFKSKIIESIEHVMCTPNTHKHTALCDWAVSASDVGACLYRFDSVYVYVLYTKKSASFIAWSTENRMEERTQ